MQTRPQRADLPSSGLAIVGVDVLPMTDRERLADQTVLVAGDEIATIGPRRDVTVPAGYRVVDARGMVLMPGLVDMHVHLAPVPGNPGDAAQRAMAVMLGHGVTTARGMAGSPNHLVVREAVERGELTGPRLYVAAPGLHGQNTPDQDAARRAVREAKQAGYDFIKSHHLSDPDVWHAVQDEARRQVLATAGHVTNEVGLARALAAGQQVEHLDGAVLELLPADAAERRIPFAQIPPPAVIAAAAQASDTTLQALAERVAQSGNYQVPTLALFERIVALDISTDALLARPEMRFVPEQALRDWSAQRDQLRAAGFTAADGRALRDLRRRIVRAYRDAGVPLMAGSDTAQAFHIWGPGLIEELETLVAAGLGPMDALRAATVVPRNYFAASPGSGSALGWTANFGVVKEGARADLIVLRDDPSVNISALRSLEMVVAGGDFHDRGALDALLGKAASDAKKPLTDKASTPAKQIFVMRHLEAGEGTDPALTETGAANAEKLSRVLAGSDVRAIFVTNTRRSRETAAPLAEKLGLDAETYDPRRPDLLAEKLKHADGNALVLGHSNTVSDLIGRLGGTPPGQLDPADFGTVWRIDGGSKVTRTFTLAGAPPVALGPCNTPGLHASARCGKVRVPEDRNKTGGRELDIHFAVLPASGMAKNDPIVFLPGGPGLGGVQAGQGIEQLFGPMWADRDIILIDQRGTGQSNALICPQSESSPLASLGGRGRNEALACRQALTAKADLARYTTRQAVLDMEQVRQALGYRRLDLLGLSYGSRVALDYLRLFPERVGQTVIRAAAPAAMMLPLHTPQDAQRSYDTLVRYCQEQADCSARHPDLAGQLRSIVARLNNGPVSIEVVDPANGQPIKAQLDRDGLSTVLFFMLYIPEFYMQLPPLIDAAARGDLSPLVQAAAPVILGASGQVAWGLRWSVICDEDVRRIEPTALARLTQNTFMGADVVKDDIEACSVWPRADVGEDYLTPVASHKPVFIISGAMDPVAGKRWGDEVARTLPNALHVEVDGASHLPVLPGCTSALTKRFLDGDALEQVDAACVDQAKRPVLKIAN